MLFFATQTFLDCNNNKIRDKTKIQIKEKILFKSKKSVREYKKNK